MCGLRTCPRTDVNPPRFCHRWTAIGGGGYRLAAPGAIPCYVTATEVGECWAKLVSVRLFVNALSWKIVRYSYGYYCTLIGNPIQKVEHTSQRDPMVFRLDLKVTASRSKMPPPRTHTHTHTHTRTHRRTNNPKTYCIGSPYDGRQICGIFYANVSKTQRDGANVKREWKVIS